MKTFDDKLMSLIKFMNSYQVEEFKVDYTIQTASVKFSRYAHEPRMSDGQNLRGSETEEKIEEDTYFHST